jgi:hypothetical protein
MLKNGLIKWGNKQIRVLLVLDKKALRYFAYLERLKFICKILR